MRVTIQFQETRKPHAWKNAYQATVLFADRGIILTRGVGSHQEFHWSGWYKSVGHSLEHPASKLIPRRTRGWRIEPKGLERIKTARRASGSRP